MIEKRVLKMENAFWAVVGAIISGLISHWYYRQSSKVIPEWAKPLIDKLPNAPVTPARLVELYHEALETGQFVADPLSGYVACPTCGAASSQFEGWERGDSRGDLYRGTRCKKCGHEIAGGEV